MEAGNILKEMYVPFADKKLQLNSGNYIIADEFSNLCGFQIRAGKTTKATLLYSGNPTVEYE